METLTIISTFLNLGISYYLYLKIRKHNEYIRLTNKNVGLIAGIMKENNDRNIKINEMLIKK